MTRGIRNNNPLNIRLTDTDWQGKGTPMHNAQCTMHDVECTMHDAQCTMKKDLEFEQFVSMYYGFRAAIRTIETYIIKHRCNTIRTIITRWAPASDGNNTERYIQYVCGSTGIGGNEPISNHDKRIKEIVWAMAHMESGKGIEGYKESLEKAFEEFVPKEVFEKERKKQYAQKY